MQAMVAAFAYLGLGWSVVPVHTPAGGRCSCRDPDCPSPGKHPRVRWQEYAEHGATTAEVREWWRRWPTANIGVVTGAVSRVAVVDIDPRSAGDATLAAIVDDAGGPPSTVETMTGGGGSHLWFVIEGDQSLASVVLGPGLELKAEGSLVVVPPSLHVSGERYVWRKGRDPWSADMAPVPSWVTAGSADVPRDARNDGPARTDAERGEFERLWEEAGLILEQGDRYYRCPFHDDEHPSLHIDAEGCRWYCFGCRRGGGTGMLRRVLGHGGGVRPRQRTTGQVGRRRAVSMRGTRDVELVGESRHQDELLELVGGRRPYGGVDATAVAELVLDPTNPFDSDAIEVLIDDRPVGYLRHEDAVAYRAEVLDSLDLHGFATCWAHIRGGWDRGHGDVGALGVTLELPEDVQR